MSACPVERNVGFEFALLGLTINIAPAAMPNEGTEFDLAIAMARVCWGRTRPPHGRARR